MDQSSKLTLQQIKGAELELLVQIKDICIKHHLRYSLAGGTLLGAVRHNGFIPWDDDIDVMMPRPDFERFIKIVTTEYADNPNFALYSIPEEHKNTLYVKVINPQIEVHEQYVKTKEYLWVDLLPVDGLPEKKKSIALLYTSMNILRMIFMLTRAESSMGRTPAKRILKKFIVPLFKFLHLGTISAVLMRKIALLNRYGSSTKMGIVTWGLYGAHECMPIDSFSALTEVEFEHTSFSSISYWNQYLTNLYGDYMTLPPVEQRVNHGMIAIPNQDDRQETADFLKNI